MTSKYRVDRTNDKTRVPCGMNSIQYIGDSIKSARSVFNNTEIGKDNWNKSDWSYGVVLSEWNDTKRDYVIIDTFGF